MAKTNALGSILNKLYELNSEELAYLKEQIVVLAPYAKEPSAEEKLLPPGHHLEEKSFTNKDGSTRTYVHERWYEANGNGYVHKSKAVFKGSKAQYLAALTANDQAD